MLGRIFGAGERKAERYVTLRGLCFDSRLYYGDWIKGEGSGGIVRLLVGNLDDESEGKRI